MTQASMRTFVDKVKREQKATAGQTVKDRLKRKRNLLPPQEAGTTAARSVIERFQKALQKIK